MTNPRSKSEKLSETTKSYLNEIYIEELFGRKKDITNKYIEKGIYVEEESLNLIQSHYLGKLLIKNKEHFENEYIKGTPDVIIDRVIDTKSSWDIFTFSEADGNNKDYYWQGQGYMNLTKKKEFDLAYCLTNAPEHMIVDEKTKQMYKRGLIGLDGSIEFDEMENEIEKNMKFDDIPLEKRVKIFSFEFDDKAFELLKQRIIDSREYLNSITF